MEYKYLGNIDYDGSQLHHAFAYEQANILGPSIVCFIGKVDVKEHLVDLEDAISNDFIKSKRMINFIIEIPEASIREMVVWQRFFIHLLAEKMRNVCNHIKIVTDGDDIMINEKKLSVSIATLSRFSGLVHVGLNLEVGEGCPVAAIGLNELTYFAGDWGASIGFTLIEEVAKEFAKEYTDIIRASYKVKEV